MESEERIVMTRPRLLFLVRRSYELYCRTPFDGGVRNIKKFGGEIIQNQLLLGGVRNKFWGPRSKIVGSESQVCLYLSYFS